MLSHLHLDHIGYVNYGGIWGMLNHHGFTVGKTVDRNAGYWYDFDENGACNPNTEIVWTNAGETGGTGRNWLCYATNPAYASVVNGEVAEVGSTTQVNLGGGVAVTIVESDGDAVDPSIQGDHTLDNP